MTKQELDHVSHLRAAVAERDEWIKLAAKALKKSEWMPGACLNRCPCCNHHRSDRHAADCELHRARMTVPVRVLGTATEGKHE